MITRILVTLVLALALVVPACAQNIVANGGFESPVVTSSSVIKAFGSVDGVWAIGDVDWYSEVYIIPQNDFFGMGTLPCPEGNQSLLLNNGHRAGLVTIAQPLTAAVVGKTYRLSFYGVGREVGQDGDAAITVNFGDWTDTYSLPTYSDADLMSGLNSWSEITTDVTITAENPILKFTLGVYGDQVILDGISVAEVAPVPEPASLMAMGVGLVGLLGIRRRLK